MDKQPKQQALSPKPPPSTSAAQPPAPDPSASYPTKRARTPSLFRIPKHRPDSIPPGRDAVRRKLVETPPPSQGPNPTARGGDDGGSWPDLPEDLWHHIHSLMPLRDAARAACLSHSFQCSWKRHPNLILSRETLGCDVWRQKETCRDFGKQIDHIMRNHSGTGVRKLNLMMVPNYNTKDCESINRWLQIAVTPAIEELILCLSVNSHKYKFPCTLLSNGMGDSLRRLCLADCYFHPSPGLCCLRSLTKLELYMVRIMGDELCSLLSSTPALEQLSLRYCSKISSLKIPCHLHLLSHVKVDECSKLRVIESKAPNLSRFHFVGKLKAQISLGETLQLKNLRMSSTVNGGCDTQAELVSGAVSKEVINSPNVYSKLLDLKSVDINLGELPFCWSFDCSSMVSLLGDSLSLETFILHVFNGLMVHALVSGVGLGWMSRTGSGLSRRNKRMVELACHVLRAWLD